MASSTPKIASGKQMELPVEFLHPNPYQPRRKFPKASLVRLADSMKKVGLMQPVFVIRHAEREGEYTIVSGERRWRAAQLNGWGEVTCKVSDMNLEPVQLAQLALVENIMREELTPIEEALQLDRFRRPVEEGGFGMSVSAIARLVSGFHRTTIQNSLSLLTLPQDVQDLVDDGFLNLSMAKIIVGLPKNFQERMAKAAVDNEWNVRQLERNTAHLSGFTGKRKKALETGKKDPELLAIEKVEQVGSDVYGVPFIVKKYPKGKWSMTLNFSSLEEMNGAIEKMGIDVDIDPYEAQATQK